MSNFNLEVVQLQGKSPIGSLVQGIHNVDSVKVVCGFGKGLSFPILPIFTKLFRFLSLLIYLLGKKFIQSQFGLSSER